MISNINFDKLLQEAILKATTSGGKGGQNVNKVATRVELYFDIPRSTTLSDELKSLLLTKLQHRTNADGVLRLVSSEKRSQLENKEQVKEKFRDLIRKAATPKKKRKQTAPSFQSNEERIRMKKLMSEKKKLRGQKYLYKVYLRNK